MMPGPSSTTWPPGTANRRGCPGVTIAAHENDIPGIRTADRRAGIQDRGTALRAGRLRGGHFGGDCPPAEEERGTDQGDLRQAFRLADLAGGQASAASLR